MFRLAKSLLHKKQGGISLAKLWAAGVVGSGLGLAYAKSQDSEWPDEPTGVRRAIIAPDGSLSAVETTMNYQDSAEVKSSLLRNGKVYTNRNTSGTDTSLHGTKWAATPVRISNARELKEVPRLEKEGFVLLKHNVDDKLGKNFNFYNDNDILNRYYPSIAETVKQATGATHVYPFDHNIRSASASKAGKKLEGGNSVQGPAHLVHTDYTLTSAPTRLRQLSKPPKINDTWRKLTDGKSPLIPPEQVEKVLAKKGRFAMVNVWRNIKKEPVQRFPLAVMDARSATADDMVTFEIHYADRVGENYFVRNSPKSPNPAHKWYYFPQMQRDEALAFKQWDSEGVLLTDAKDEKTARAFAPGVSTPPPQFCAHSAFVDPTTKENAPDRESIEVRCMLLYLDEEKNRKDRLGWNNDQPAAAGGGWFKSLLNKLK
mmetsp:Transcript_11137/g.20438  ORF Transcript_11137/g.20438 Transcript_11137/m.20438 type:complete len:429 (+) Transcript_11137:83-1369(+)